MPLTALLRVPRGRIGSAGLGLLAAFAMSCGGEDGEPPTPSPRATLTVATAAATAEPSVTRVAEEWLSELAAIVLSGDAEALNARLMAQPVQCRNNQPPLPDCASGHGTEVARVPFVGCEPGYLPLEEASRLLGQILLTRSPSLHAALEALRYDQSQAFPLGPYALVFETLPPVAGAEPTAVMLVANAGGEVVSFRTGCRATPERLTGSVPNARELQIEPARP